jgi:uncharacterized membrane protein
VYNGVNPQEMRMTLEVWGMMGAGIAALVAGLVLVRTRFAAASGLDKVLVLGPVFEAVPLAIFSMEHLLAAHDLTGAVPTWLPGPLFWVYFFGVALLAAAVSFILWKCVPWSASLLTLFFLIIVATVDLPNLPGHVHERLFWTLNLRELCFAGGAMVLAGSVWPRGGRAGVPLIRVGRNIVALVMIVYGIEHFFFPHNVPGVPLMKMTPDWVPAPMVLAYFIGVILIAGGFGLFVRRTVRIAAAGAGTILVLLVAFFYVPIAVVELYSNLAVEGINYVGDTLLFAATIMLAGLGVEKGAS